MADAPVIHYNDSGEWPVLSPLNLGLVVGYPIVALILCYVWLRVLWPPSEATKNPPNPSEKLADAEKGHGTQGGSMGTKEKKKATAHQEGQQAQGYDARDPKTGELLYKWQNEFDGTFLKIQIGSFVALAIATQIVMPDLWTNYMFWLLQLPKLCVMMGVSVLGGALCRYMCVVDDDGYIQTKKAAKDYISKWNADHPDNQKAQLPEKSWFKVNYTRKLQHFAAYAVPLFIKSNVEGTLALCWGDWFTMLGFLMLIQPIRERSSFFMLQFNSLDRPEDRPNTMKWIIALNILPGLCCIILFRYIYAFTGQVQMAMIWIFITGVGDGLAEPVGITWGKHKYWTTAMCTGKAELQYYSRSFEGSCCVFMSGVIFTSVYWASFANQTQFWVCMVLLPPLSAYAEAIAPHTGDTPFLMILGGVVCLGCSYLPPLI